MANNNSEGIFSAGEKWDQTQVNIGAHILLVCFILKLEIKHIGHHYIILYILLDG